jgi:hypothetical protein
MVAEYALKPDAEDEAASPPPYQAVEIPGKGIGLVANRTIRTGERLMTLKPTFMAHIQLHNSRLAPLLYEKAVEFLPEKRRIAFMKMMGSDIRDKIDTNGFQTGISKNEDDGHISAFVEASRLNHDCRPK